MRYMPKRLGRGHMRSTMMQTPLSLNQPLEQANAPGSSREQLSKEGDR